MTTKGRPRKAADERTGHRRDVGKTDAIEVAPVDARLVHIAPPADLSPLASEVWAICVADMCALGHLREPDLLQLRNYSVQCAIAIECEASISEFGAMMKEPITATDLASGDTLVVGYKLKANPACKLHRESANAVRLLATELGLTPLARIRGNLMQAATASIALGIKDDLEAEMEAADIAQKKASTPRARKKAPATRKKAPE